MLFSSSARHLRLEEVVFKKNAGGGGGSGSGSHSHSTLCYAPPKSNNATAWQKSALISSSYLQQRLFCLQNILVTFVFFAALIFLCLTLFLRFLRSCSAKLAFSTFPFTYIR